MDIVTVVAMVAVSLQGIGAIVCIGMLARSARHLGKE